jgi:hypothetical protein
VVNDTVTLGVITESLKRDPLNKTHLEGHLVLSHTNRLVVNLRIRDTSQLLRNLCSEVPNISYEGKL